MSATLEDSASPTTRPHRLLVDELERLSPILDEARSGTILMQSVTLDRTVTAYAYLFDGRDLNPHRLIFIHIRVAQVRDVKGTPGLDSLIRAFDRNRGNESAQDASASPDSSEIPDLFANNDNLHEITMVRDAVGDYAERLERSMQNLN